MRVIALSAALTMFIALPASADWQSEGWELKRTLPGNIEEEMTPKPKAQPAVQAEWIDPNYHGMGNRTTDVERYRSLVAQHFLPGDVETALRVMACESGGNPYAKNPTSTASGLYQHLRGWWSGAWGIPAFDPFDPESSVAAAAHLRYTRGSWGDWYPSAYCWG